MHSCKISDGELNHINSVIALGLILLEMEADLGIYSPCVHFYLKVFETLNFSATATKHVLAIVLPM